MNNKFRSSVLKKCLFARLLGSNISKYLQYYYSSSRSFYLMERKVWDEREDNNSSSCEKCRSLLPQRGDDPNFLNSTPASAEISRKIKTKINLFLFAFKTKNHSFCAGSFQISKNLTKSITKLIIKTNRRKPSLIIFFFFCRKLLVSFVYVVELFNPIL